MYSNVILVPSDGIAQSIALVFVEGHAIINEGVVGFDTAKSKLYSGHGFSLASRVSGSDYLECRLLEIVNCPSYPMEGLAENHLNGITWSLVDLHHVHHFQVLGLGSGRGVVGGDNILH